MDPAWAKVVDDLFRCYDLASADGQLERAEFLATEERIHFILHGNKNLDVRQRKAAVAWFQAVGATGDVRTGMFLTREASAGL